MSVDAAILGAMDVHLAAGVYEITTATGSLYELVVGERSTLRRLPRALTPEASHADLSTALRRDNEPISVLKILRLEVGTTAGFLLDLRGDGIITVRETSEVLRIQRTADAPANVTSFN